MTTYRKTAALIAAAAMTISLPAMAQVSQETKVSTDTSMHDGVATRTTKVEHVKKVKTHRPKKILGVKVGHKTKTTKVVRERSVSSNGDASSKVKVSN